MLRLTLIDPEGEERELVLPGPLVRIGRAPHNDLVIPDSRVSSNHARILVRGATCFFEDLGSRNGSMVEHQKVRTVARQQVPLPVYPGDLLLLGDLVSPIRIRVEAMGEEASDPAAGATVVAHRAICEGRDALRVLDAAALRALFHLLHDLSGQSEPVEVMARIADAVLERFDAIAAVCVLLRDAEGSFVPEFSRSCEEGAELPLPGPRLLSRVVSEAELLLYLPDGESRAEDRVGSGDARAALVPLTSGAKLIGVLHVLRRRGSFLPDDAAWLSIIGLHMAASLARARHFRSLMRTEARLREENLSLLADAAMRRPIIGRSAALRSCLELLCRVARTSTTVLLEGETGTGKELAAHYLHLHSPRAQKAFLPINCAALPAQLLESELFGHRKGAFTGAVKDHQGIFEAASGGTVFLDEIGELPLELQGKLLRVIQERELRPVGAARSVSVDVRIVAASNRDLRAEAEAGRFRKDLYYRLSVFPVELPPLRARTGDVELLAEHFRESFCARHGTWVPGFSAEALGHLRGYSWPGNVRELEHCVERAIILSTEGQPISREQLSPLITGASPEIDEAAKLPRGKLKQVMALLEERIIRRCLEEQGSSRTRAAAELGISRQALQVKLARWRDR